MGEQSKKWYVVKAISGKEKKAKEYIENEVAHSGLSEFVSRVLIPTEKVFSVRNGKRVSKDRTLFPGYVLIEASLEGEVAHVIKNVPNVIDFLSEKDGKPVPLQDFEVKRILGRVDEMMDNDEELLEPFIVGETVIHRVFGKGMIVSLKPMGNDTLMEIAFEKVGTKKIMANMGVVKKV
jgi:transcriptional antiterminator NusG